MTLNNWNEYTGKSWLSAEDVKDADHGFVVINVGLSEEDKRPVLELQSDDLVTNFQLNVTNANKCKETVDSPNKLIGKKLYFRKIMATNPQTKKEVEALRILKVE